MDIIGGLTAAKLALGLAKDLRDIDHLVDEAGYKLKLAKLTSALADTQAALADAKNKISDLEAALAGEKGGVICPVCKTGRLTETEIEETYMSESIQFHTCECDQENYAYKNKRVFDTGLNNYRASP